MGKIITKKLVLLTLTNSLLTSTVIATSCYQNKAGNIPSDNQDKANDNQLNLENIIKTISLAYPDPSSVNVLDANLDLVKVINYTPNPNISFDWVLSKRNYLTNELEFKTTLTNKLDNSSLFKNIVISGFKEVPIKIDNLPELHDQNTDISTDYANLSVLERSSINFNNDWKFKYGDEASSSITSLNYNDRQMTNLNLPHDWSIFFDFSPNISNEWGALEGGVSWYRKSFNIPKEWQDQEINIHFGGVFSNSQVWINGHLLGKYPSGYYPFTYNLTKYINFGGENVIAVKAENKRESSRWYSGSGIYRDVKLEAFNKVRTIRDGGIVITTPKLKTQKDSNAETKIQYKLENKTNIDKQIVIEQTIIDKNTCEVVATNNTETLNLPAHSKNYAFENTILVNRPKLWDTEAPNLYLLKTKIWDGKSLIQETDTRFGYRYFDWTANDGFSINGREIKFNGVSMHHDQGALGAINNYDAIYRQMKMMKDMGVNAIRSTHNPADINLIEICEDLGLLLINESFDTWYTVKKRNDYGNVFNEIATHPDANGTDVWAKFDLQQMIKQTINSPAIFAYSIGNEINEAYTQMGVDTTKKLVDWAKEIDKTRYITWGNDKYRYYVNDNINRASSLLDTVGFNYSEDNLDYYRTNFPNWKIYGAETSSSLNSRGVYFDPDDLPSGTPWKSIDAFSYQLSDFGNSKVGWGKSAFGSWKFDRDRKWYTGQFIWTGWDYIGEPTPWNQRSGADVPKSSYSGIVDTAGFAKNDYYLYQSQWLDPETKPMVHIFPHWSWDNEKYRKLVQNSEGKIPIRIYSNADKVELFKNGVSLGVKTFKKVAGFGEKKFYNEGENGKLYLEWLVDYTPGKIEAKALDKNSKIVAINVIETAKDPVKIKLTPEKTVIKADGVSLSYIQVSAIDENGVENPWADNNIIFDIEGPGEIVSVDNGNAASRERYKAQPNGVWSRKLFSGKAIVIVQSKTNEGKIKLSASSTGLKSDSTNIFTINNIDSSLETIKYVDLDTQYSFVNEELNLPSTVKVVLNNGKFATKQVTWDITGVNTNNIGTYQASFVLENKKHQINVEIVDFASTFKVRNIHKTIHINSTNQEILNMLPNTIEATNGVINVVEEVIWNEQIETKNNHKIITGHLRKHPPIKFEAIFALKDNIDYIVFENNLFTSENIANISSSYQQGNDQAANVITATPNVNRRWTTWKPGNNSNAKENYLTFELHKQHKIGALALNLYVDRNTGNNGPEQIIIEYSNDNNNFIKVSNQSNVSDFAANDINKTFIVNFDPINAKYIRVKAISRTKTNNQYWVTGFTRIQAYESKNSFVLQNNANLQAIKYNNKLLPDFDPNKTVYNLNIPYSQEWPDLTFETDKANNVNVEVVEISNCLSKTYLVNAIGEDGKVKNYTVNIQKTVDKVKSQTLDLSYLPVGQAQKAKLTIKLEDDTFLDISKVENLKFYDENGQNPTLFSYENDYILAQTAGSEKVYAEFKYKNQIYKTNVVTLNILESLSEKLITSTEVIKLETMINQTATLPNTISINYEGERFARKERVLWSKSTHSFNEPGVYEVEGFIERTNQKVFASILVSKLQYTETVYTTSVQGFLPELPQWVLTYDNFGNQKVINVVWEKLNNSQFSRLNQVVKITGKLVGLDQEVEANVLVVPKLEDENVSRAVTGFEYPAIFAGYSSETQNENNRISNLNDGIINPNNKWSDLKQNNLQRQNYIGAIFAKGGVLTSKQIDQLQIIFGHDTNSSAPKTYTIQYLDTKPTDLPDFANLGNINNTNSNLKNNSLWKNVSIISQPSTLSDDIQTPNIFKFKPVNAYAIRILMTHKDGSTGDGIIVHEFSVFSPVASIPTEYDIDMVKVNGLSFNEFDKNIHEYNLNTNSMPVIEFVTTKNPIIRIEYLEDRIIYILQSLNKSNISKYTFKLKTNDKNLLGEEVVSLRSDLIAKLSTISIKNGLFNYLKSQVLIEKINFYLKNIFSKREKFAEISSEVEKILSSLD
ncbi:sugar-binding domain-containing protein [Mycoplasma corogypsi]|uniref:sugar-binding domain-containing protein n=1 Tax=Mycoplasma corogypsi TaxID=2106 RepID=UPI003873C5F0